MCVCVGGAAHLWGGSPPQGEPTPGRAHPTTSYHTQVGPTHRCGTGQPTLVALVSFENYLLFTIFSK